jgi:hypothetical protein
LIATFEKDWISTGFDEARDAVKTESAADSPTSPKVTRALAKEMPPLKSTLKKAIKLAVTNAGKEAVAEGELKSTVKDTVKAAVKTAMKQAVKEIVQEQQGN